MNRHRHVSMTLVEHDSGLLLLEFDGSMTVMGSAGSFQYAIQPVLLLPRQYEIIVNMSPGRVFTVRVLTLHPWIQEYSPRYPQLSVLVELP